MMLVVGENSVGLGVKIVDLRAGAKMVGSGAAEPQRPVDDKFIRMSGFAGCWNCSAPLPRKGCKSALVKGSLLLPGLYWFRVLKTYWYKLTTEVASGGTVQKFAIVCTAGDLRGLNQILWLYLFGRSSLSLLNEPVASAALCCFFLEGGLGVPWGPSYSFTPVVSSGSVYTVFGTCRQLKLTAAEPSKN
jgi:hypothetical protein